MVAFDNVLAQGGTTIGESDGLSEFMGNCAAVKSVAIPKMKLYTSLREHRGNISVVGMSGLELINDGVGVDI